MTSIKPTINPAATADGALPRWGVAIALAAVGIILYGAGIYDFIMFAALIAAEYHWPEAEIGGLSVPSG